MPAAISTFVDVSVTIAGAVAEKFSFGTPLGVFEHNITNNRIDGPYTDIAAVNSAGFTSVATPEINAWATAVFSQDDGVNELLIGRRIPAAGGFAASVLQVVDIGPVFVDMTDEYNNVTVADWVVFPAAEATDDYAAIGMTEKFGQIIVDNTGGTAGTVGEVDWEYWDGTAWVALAGVVDGTSEFTAAAAAGQSVTWTIPADWATLSLDGGPALFYIRAVITTVYTIDPIYDTGTAAGDVTWTATMDNIELAQEINGLSDWYITNIESRVKADILLVAAWTEPRSKIYMAQSSDADILSDTAGNVAETLNGLLYTRTALWYTANDAQYLDGAISSSGGGLNLDVPGGVGIWGFRPLEGVTFDNVTGLQATNIFANAANFNGRNLQLSFSQEGTMAAGKPRFIDVTTTIDWVIKRSEEAVLSLQVGTPTKIPYTNAGINQIVGAVQGVLDGGVSFGHFTEDNPPTIKAPDASDVSAADKAARILTIEVSAVLSGAVQKVVIPISLSF